MASGGSPRERLLALLRGERPDRVPWFGDLDYWATALEAKGARRPGFKRSREYIEWHRSLGVGFYLQGCFPFREEHEGCSVTERRQGASRSRRIETPLGALEEEWRSLPDSYSEAPVRRLVRSARDLPALRYFYEHARYEPDYALVSSRLEQVGDAGIVLAYLPRSPFMHLVVMDAGIEAVTECAADAPGKLEETLAAMARAHDLAGEIALGSPAEALMIPENLSSEVVGRSFYRRYVEGWQRRWVARIREAGKKSFVHMDGSLRGLLAEVAAVGFDVLEALTPAPVGDLAVEEWARAAGSSSSILWGGLPGSYFTAHVPEEEFHRHVRAVLALMRSSPRYVLGVADQVPPDALERRVAEVRHLVERYG